MKWNNLKLYFTSSDTTGCSGYRVKNPARFLQQFNPNIVYHEGFPMHDKEGHMWSDVILAQRINHEHFLELIPYLQSLGKKFVIDMDDNLWEIPHGNLARVHYDQATLDRIGVILGLADALVCSTEPLAHYYSQFNKNIFISPNMIQDVYPFREDMDNPVPRVGWAGSYTHAFEFSDHLDRHLKMLVKYDKIRSVVSGFDGKLPKQAWKKVVDIFKYSEKHGWVAYDEWMEYLNKLNFDIGYAVVEHNIFNECKSNVKFLEYSACSIPMIAASSYPYNTTIKHGETGFIVRNDKTEWKEYINLLLDDKDLRKTIAFNAWDYVKNNYTYKYAGDRTVKVYDQLFDFLYEGKTEGMWNNYDIEYIGKKG